jgi:AcrR family transcriptional regulator
VPRWPDDARARLRAAAAALIAEQGYAATTVDQVAARAGVSQRTFFRHFTDKEEVLFADDDRLLAVVVGTVAATAPGTAPVDAVRAGLVALARAVEGDRSQLQARAAAIAGEPALRGRELLKRARWAEEVARVLVQRGTPPVRAAAVTGAGAAVWGAVWAQWLADDGPAPLAERLDAALAELAGDLAGPR